MTTSPPDDPAPVPRKRFLRSRDDRLLGGVAGGLGTAFGVDAVIFRIALAALAFAGGAGLLAYVAAVLLVPADDGTGQPAPRSATWRRLATVSALVVAGLLFATLAFWGSAWATAAGGGIVVAAAVVALGVALLVGAVRGDRRARWLAVPAILIAFPAAVVSAADVSLDGGIGERTYRPTGAEQLPGGYRVGMGELEVDLRDLDWSGGRRVELDVDVGVGHALVLVPDDVCVGARSEIGVGYSDVFGRDAAGIEVDHDVRRAPPAGTAALALDADVGMGAVEVVHKRPYEGARFATDRRGYGLRDGVDDGLRDEGRIADRACAGSR